MAYRNAFQAKMPNDLLYQPSRKEAGILYSQVFCKKNNG